MGLDSVVVGISTMLVFWSLASLVRNSVVLTVYLLFSVACFFTVHEHYSRDSRSFIKTESPGVPAKITYHQK